MSTVPHEQRRHVRYPVEYAGSFSVKDVHTNGVILNLSIAGCRALSDVPLSAREVGVHIEVPRRQNPLKILLATVRWTQGTEFGVEFLRMEPDQERRLRELIQENEADLALRIWQRG
ncbi:MAG: PilZ domain-containing protein [Nitrospira sp.]|nr:PilZ domain-containing protein [Nitrospira sp.]